MSYRPQLGLDLHDKIIVDLFAGGGGASSGIEQALGRPVDIAINHDARAVAMHQANHPTTAHYTSDVFEVDPRIATGGRPIGLLWASPDCTYHSKARGKKPIRTANKKRRALAWVVTRWAAQVKPDVIMLENVEEFEDWGPLIGPKDELRPCPKRRGRTFRRWVRTLQREGYAVEWRELRACDYGAPTIRKRLFVIARRDGQPIVWPAPTHGDDAARKKTPALKRFRAIAECIDWTIPMCSIFATSDEAAAWAKAHGVGRPIRPLKPATCRRIARGVKRFVIDNPKPFLVTIAHGEEGPNSKRWGKGFRGLDVPMGTVTSKPEDALVAPVLAGVGGRAGQSAERSGEDPAGTVTAKADVVIVAPVMVKNNFGKAEESVEEPLKTICAGANHHAVVAPVLATYYGEHKDGEPRANAVDEPLGTQPTENRFAVVAPLLVPRYGERKGQAPRTRSAEEPGPSVVPTGNGAQLVAGFMAQHNGGFYEGGGRELTDPLATILTESRGHHGLTAVHIQRDFGTSTGSEADKPVGTITTEGAGKAALVASFLTQYNGTGTGQEADEPMNTATTTDRFGVVNAMADGVEHVIVDIAMRMLQPKELYLAQGFRPGYIIDRTWDGQKITKTEQVRMCGNSVSPVLAEALARANVGHLLARRAA